jgi:uncharacterized protein (UPF0335 family)
MLTFFEDFAVRSKPPGIFQVKDEIALSLRLGLLLTHRIPRIRLGALEPLEIQLSHLTLSGLENLTPRNMEPRGAPSIFVKNLTNSNSKKRNTNMLKRTALITVPMLVLLMGGCASTAELKASIDQAQRTADEAKRLATEAKSAAADAKSTAMDAKGAADSAANAAAKAQADANEAKQMASQAQQDASAAKSAADAANQKADRMFKKAMSK